MRSIVALALLSLAALGCSSSAPASAPAASGDSGWHLEGTRVIGCCCVMPCSCRINKPPTQAHGCEYTTAVHVDKGSIGTTKMDGVNWLQIGLGFGENTQTNWVVVYVDDKVSDAQMKALQGWMEAGMKELNAKKKVPYLAGSFVGFKKIPMTWEASKDREAYVIKAPGILDLQVKAIRNPGHPEPVTSVGVLDDFGNSFVHCNTAAHSYKDASLKYDGWDLKDRQSNYAHFVIGSDVKMPYAVGWGCWSAHKDFQTDGNYQERLLNHPKK
jgi:hypothetical protein